ncbi:MAG: ABC transporter permease subunit [Thermoanaerobaculia bacterium]
MSSTGKLRLVDGLVYGSMAPLCLLVFWHFVADRFSLPSILSVLSAFGEMGQNGTFGQDIFISSLRALTGFLIGFTAGVAVGVLTGRYRFLFILIGGSLLFLRWTPVLAILPLTIRVGGLGETPKIFLIAWGCFFVTWAYAHVALRRLDPQIVWWCDSLDISRFQRMTRIYLPAAAPAIIAAARVALSIALIVVVAAEMTGTPDYGFFRGGLGYRIVRAIDTNRLEMNVACILTLGVLGLAYDWLFLRFVRHILQPITGMLLERDTRQE